MILEGEKIKDIKEKPEFSQDTSAGIYVINPEMIDYIDEDYFDMPELIMKCVEKGKNALSYDIKDYWIAIDGPEQLDTAILEKEKWS